MRPFEAYQTFITLKAHFKNSGFDYHKFGKVKVAPETFERRKDRYYFEKLAKRYSRDEIVEFFLSQILANKTWVGDMLGEDAEAEHLSRLRRVQALQYQVKTEMNTLWERCKEDPECFNKLFLHQDGTHPGIFRAVMEKKISAETFLVLDSILGFTKRWRMDGDPIWEEVGIPILRYAPFLHLDTRRDDLKRIISEIITNKLHTKNT
jgi:hypothetical protein